MDEVQDLQGLLAIEQRQNAKLRAEVAQLKKQLVGMAAAEEEQGERHVNTLLRKQRAMKEEKERTINEFEKEDEGRTNMFLKKLAEARSQTSALENALEAEQESIVN